MARIYDIENNPCHKRTYSLGGAVRALAQASNELDPKDRPKRFYYCDICKLYHLTSMSLTEQLKYQAWLDSKRPEENLKNRETRKKRKKNKNRPRRKVDTI